MGKVFKVILFVGLFVTTYVLVHSFTGDVSHFQDFLPGDLALFAGVFLVMLFVYSQFIIPTNKLQNRVLIFLYSFLHMVGFHGVPQRIENGRLYPENINPNKKGPFILLVDTASAGLVEDNSNHTHPVGPGVHFMGINTHVGATAVLSPQMRTLGPLLDEDPFAPFNPQTEPESDYEQRQTRRRETNGRTRDGIELSPTLTINFAIDPRVPRQVKRPLKIGRNAVVGPGLTEYGYCPESVTAALVDRSSKHPAPGRQPHSTEWQWIPGRLTIDLWREYIGRFTFTQLFPDQPATDGLIQTILGYMRARLQSPHFLAMDPLGRLDPTSRAIPSREYALLQSYGLRVNWISLDYLHLPSDAEKLLFQKWQAAWPQQTEQIRASIEREYSIAAEQGHNDALRSFAISVTHQLGNIAPGSSLSPAQVLNFLVRDTLDHYSRDPALHQASQTQIQQLQKLLKWVNEQP
ncbi:MAG TPA: hypothetical protein VN376_10675 [Longilinea sp.]|nr:hypothetical protein [Longilinea sp.]